MKQTGSSNVTIAVAIAAVAVLAIGLFFFRSGSAPSDSSDPAGRAAEGAAQPGAPGTARGVGDASAQAPGEGGRLGAFSGLPAQRQRREAGDEETARRPGSAAPRPGGEVDPLDENPEDIPTLRRVALEDPDPERRLAAVTLLGISDNPAAIPVLAEVLSDEDENVRMEAVLSLADFTDEAPVDALSQALSDPSADIRYEALDVLSDIETREAKLAVQRALNDPDEDVRELAEIILEMWEDEEF